MALQYDYTKVDTEGWNKEQHSNAANFAWTMISIDMREITHKNQGEIFFRLKFLETIGRNIFKDPIKDAALREHIRLLEGYKTNVKEEPRFKFIRRWIKGLERDLEEKLSV